MKLIDLEPQFLKTNEDGTLHHYVDSIKEADGIRFLCPLCFKNNKGSVGTHGCICWQPHVPQNISPKPGRWYFDGTGYDNLTLRNGSSSILLNGDGCKAHFFIKDGEVTGEGI
jgi:hypothetical protein